MAQPRSRYEIADWVAGDALVLGMYGRLDAAACASLAERLRELVAAGPGVRITIELSGVAEVDVDAWEDLVLTIAGVYARRAVITFAGARGGIQAVLNRLGIQPQPMGRLIGRIAAGVTA